MFWKKMQALSIKKQLLLWLIGPLLFLSIVSAGITYWLALQLSNEIYDELLINTADSVVARIDYINGKRVIDFPESAEAMFRHQDRDKFFYKIFDQDGHFISGDEFIPSLMVKTKEPLFADARVGGEDLRMVSLFSPVPDKKDRTLVVQVAETCNARISMVHKIALTILILEFVIVIGGAIALWIGVNAGLAPLQKIRLAMAKRSPTDLTPVTIERAPPEVLPMIDAINSLLSEVQLYIASQSRFVSDAAHQLRTPLAGLKTFVDLGTKQADNDRSEKIFEQLNIGVMRMTQMVNKLLSLAKVEGESERFKPHDQVDLNELAQDVVHTVWEPLKRKSKTKVHCEPGLEPLMIDGSESSIRDLLENLVHNAILYTQDGGEILVSVTNNGGVELVVEDNGPGIPESERKKVFDRFYRIDSSVNTTGSGLGLAIVQEIADRHAATIELTEGSSGKGCRFTVKFKSSQTPASRDISVSRRQYLA